jgi:hypothetical protein
LLTGDPNYILFETRLSCPPVAYYAQVDYVIRTDLPGTDPKGCNIRDLSMLLANAESSVRVGEDSVTAMLDKYVPSSLLATPRPDLRMSRSLMPSTISPYYLDDNCNITVPTLIAISSQLAYDRYITRCTRASIGSAGFRLGALGGSETHPMFYTKINLPSLLDGTTRFFAGMFSADPIADTPSGVFFGFRRTGAVNAPLECINNLGAVSGLQATTITNVAANLDLELACWWDGVKVEYIVRQGITTWRLAHAPTGTLDTSTIMWPYVWMYQTNATNRYFETRVVYAEMDR